VDWGFVLLVVLAFSVAGFVIGVLSGNIRGGPAIIAGVFGSLVVAIPLGIVAVGLMWLTNNNRFITGLATAVLGLYAILKTVRETKLKYGP